MFTAQAFVQVQQDGADPRSHGYKYTLSYKRNTPHGAYKSWFDSTQLRDEGNFKMGVPDGQWKGWYKNGQPRFIRTYDAAKLQRIRQEIKKHPRHTLIPLAVAAQKDRSVLQDAISPVQSFWHLYGKRHDERAPVAVDSASGAATASEPPADLGYLPPFKECLHHGLYMNYYPDGHMKDSGYYKNGWREGHWEHWLSEQQLKASGTYRHSKRSGTWRYQSRNGNIRSLATYNSKGELVHQQFYD